uniref:Plasma membrane ATPase 4-like n=1 Tax=Rhizophora mucronata TaxID=61149 RepID=A0A2P2PYK2_RHIMU
MPTGVLQGLRELAGDGLVSSGFTVSFSMSLLTS